MFLFTAKITNSLGKSFLIPILLSDWKSLKPMVISIALQKPEKEKRHSSQGKLILSLTIA